MSTQTLSIVNGPAKRPLQTDGLFCTLTGLLGTLGAEPISTFMGLKSSAPLFILGVIVLVYGLALFAYTTYRNYDSRLAWLVIDMNALWVVASIVLLVADPLGLSTEGRWTVLIMADLVGALGIWQFLSLRRAR